jgi:hypothetical protein
MVDVKTTNVRLLHIGAHVRPLCVRRQVQVSDKQYVVPPILDLIMIVPRQLFDAAHRPTDTVTGLL